MIFSVMDIPGIPFVEKNDFNAANIALGTDISGSVSGSSNLSGATGAASGSSVFTWNSGSASSTPATLYLLLRRWCKTCCLPRC